MNAATQHPPIGATGTTQYGERIEVVARAHDPARIAVIPAGADPRVVETFTPRIANITWDAA